MDVYTAFHFNTGFPDLQSMQSIKNREVACLYPLYMYVYVCVYMYVLACICPTVCLFYTNQKNTYQQILDALSASSSKSRDRSQRNSFFLWTLRFLSLACGRSNVNRNVPWRRRRRVNRERELCVAGASWPQLIYVTVLQDVLLRVQGRKNDREIAWMSHTDESITTAEHCNSGHHSSRSMYLPFHHSWVTSVEDPVASWCC